MNSSTRDALRDFQLKEKLPVDGIAGPETEKALIEAKVSGKTSAVATELTPRQYYQQPNGDQAIQAEVVTNRKSREYIKWVQRALNQLMSAGLSEDGIAGRRTRSAVKAFQRRAGLTVDGLVGSNTESALATYGFVVPAGTQIPRIAATGPWVLPAQVQFAGERQFVRYDSPPAWSDYPSNCSKSFTSGAEKLRQHIQSTHAGVARIGGYSCRKNSANRSETSVHGVGRALDIMIPTIGGRANKAVGDPIANWLVKNAQNIGVQYLIWNRTKWSGSRRGIKHGRYGGPSPHVDHLHVELNIDAARQLTPWFSQSSQELMIA